MLVLEKRTLKFIEILNSLNSLMMCYMYRKFLAITDWISTISDETPQLKSCGCEYNSLTNNKRHNFRMI